VTITQIVRVIAFACLSAWLVFVSRKSLRQPRSHGFYRFLAWECILGLFLLNVDRWFVNPFSGWQLISWVLLIVSGWLVLHAVFTLRKYGQPDQQREEARLIAFEKTTRLVTQGAYHYIRHPMYSSLLLLAWGIFCKDPGWVSGLLSAAATGWLIATARADEAESMGYFGTAYLEYKKRTRMFIPFLF
jgi:protein-S-isoprenylcysteine O-methyltransferase Ste14